MTIAPNINGNLSKRRIYYRFLNMKQTILIVLLLTVGLADSIVPRRVARLSYDFQPVLGTNYSSATYSILWNGVVEKEENAKNMKEHHRSVALNLLEGVNSLTFSKSDNMNILDALIQNSISNRANEDEEDISHQSDSESKKDSQHQSDSQNKQTKEVQGDKKEKKDKQEKKKSSICKNIIELTPDLFNVEIQLQVLNGCIISIHKKAPIFTIECDFAVNERLSLNIGSTGNYFDFFICPPSGCISIGYKTITNYSIQHISQQLDISQVGMYYIGVKRQGAVSYYPSIDNFDLKRNGVSLLKNTGFEDGISPWVGFRLMLKSGQEVNQNWATNQVMVVYESCAQGIEITADQLV